MRVLYVEHGPHISGGQRSLLELMRALPPEIEAEMLCPPGPMADAVASLGIRVTPIVGTEGSFKLHPVHTIRTLWEMGRMARALRRRVREGRFEVVHANSVRAGLVAVLAFGRAGAKRPAVVTHVRDSLPPSVMGRAVRAAVAAGADQIIAISQHTRANFGRGRVVVIHNPVDTARFAPDAGARAVDLAGPATLIGVVGQLSPWKGQDDAIHAVAEVRAGGHDVRLAIVGEAKFVHRATRFDNRAYEERLHALVRELQIEEAVVFTGERDDVPAVMRALDLLLLPSWEEPFGRTIIEAMAAGTPVIATDQGGPPEIIRDGVDGYLLPPREPRAWDALITELVADKPRRLAVASAARARVEADFGVERHLRAVIDVYRALLERRP
jgi:glycosyltransferase involved in cell wall biosynthesis